jgi:hypothetical protein
VDASPDDSAACRTGWRDPRVVPQVLRATSASTARCPRPGRTRRRRLGVPGRDLQDPPSRALLLDRLAAGDVAAVFAGRRGAYESPLRLVNRRATAP